VRTPNDFRALYAASRRGNFPMLRAYSGTDDFIRYAEMLVETIHNAWCAIPLFWFNQMDGRGPWDLEGSIRERVTVASAVGIRARTSLEWLKLAYDTIGEDLHEAIHNQPGYYGIKAPPTLNHRYIFEDVPMSLVPMASLGMRYGVSVRGMESIIRIGSIIHRTDYWRRGRTVERLGLEQWSVSELTRFVQEGVIE
jgi:hypothetical protein